MAEDRVGGKLSRGERIKLMQAAPRFAGDLGDLACLDIYIYMHLRNYVDHRGCWLPGGGRGGGGEGGFSHGCIKDLDDVLV